MKQLNSYEVIEKWLPYVFFRTIGGIILSTIAEEIKKRRTFAIISHPDAGKTTLTEKFLLYGQCVIVKRVNDLGHDNVLEQKDRIGDL